MLRARYFSDGLEPVAAFLEQQKQARPTLQRDALIDKMLEFPTLVWLAESWRWPVDVFMEALCLAGATLALLAACSASWRTTLTYATLWFCYLSIAQVGQTFMAFQWDAFLLEVGFLTTLLAPLWPPPPPRDRQQQGGGYQATWETHTPAAAVWTSDVVGVDGARVPLRLPTTALAPQLVRAPASGMS